MNGPLHRFHPSDETALEQLIESVGWALAPGRLRAFLGAGEVFGFRGYHDIAASAAVFDYGSRLASLGLVITHPDWQRRGLARAVVQHAQAECEARRAPLTLVATEQGRPLYASLGFITVGTVHRFSRPGGTEKVKPTAGYTVEPMRPDDLSAVWAWDEQVVGGPRQSLLRQLWLHSGMEGRVVRQDGRLTGAVGLTRIEQLVLVGPLFAASDEIALALLRSVYAEPDVRLRLDVPGEHGRFMSLLRSDGFVEDMVSPIMLWGGDALPGHREPYYGMLDPALG